MKGNIVSLSLPRLHIYIYKYNIYIYIYTNQSGNWVESVNSAILCRERVRVRESESEREYGRDWPSNCHFARPQHIRLFISNAIVRLGRSTIGRGRNIYVSFIRLEIVDMDWSQRTFRLRRISSSLSPPLSKRKEKNCRREKCSRVFPLDVVIRRISRDEIFFPRIFTRRESSRNRAIRRRIGRGVARFIRFALPRSLVLTRACRKKKSLGESFSRRQRVKGDKDRTEIRSGARNLARAFQSVDERT